MNLSQQLQGTGSLLDATSAVRNGRALALLLATMVSTVLLFCLMAASGNGFLVFIGTLLSLATLFYGVNAVGVMLMDAARSGESRSMVDALMTSLMTSHRILLVALTAMVAVLAALLAVALIFLVCKIPLLGPVLFTFAFPLCALAVGFLLFTLLYVFYPLASSAVWCGATTRETLVSLVAIARQRLVSVVVKEVLLMLLVWLVMLIIGGIVFSGMGIVSAMSAAILGQGESGSLTTMLPMMMGSMGGVEGGMSGHLIAASLGGGLLMVLGFMIPMLISLQGFCLIYLTSLEGLDTGATEQLLAAGQQQFEEKRRDLQARMEAQRQRRTAPVAARADEPADAEEPVVEDPVVELPRCPHCQAELDEPDDHFCGQCGQRLR